MTTRFLPAAVFLAVLTTASSANGQAVEASREEPRLHAGPLQLFPVMTIRDIGIDSNVYNDADVKREDFTYTVSPALRTVLPIGDARLTTRGALDFRYFETHKDQQSASGSVRTELEMSGGRVRPFGTAGLLRSHERGSYDVDARAAGRASEGRLGARIALTPATSLTGWITRETTSFDSGQRFAGVDLGQQLDRVTRGTASGLRFDLTPFTSITSAIEIDKIRFKHASLRDANSFRFAPVVQFAEGAIIEGEASAGFRDFRPLDPRLAPYRGFVSTVKLSFTVARNTRIEGEGARDVSFSYDEEQPLYLGSGGRLTLVQRVIGPVEAIALGGYQELRYQRLDGQPLSGRREHVQTVGGGLGYTVDGHLRLTLTVDREERISTGPLWRHYERRRVFASVSYTP